MSLALAVFPAIAQFGMLTGPSIVFAFLSSLLILPPALVIRDALVYDHPSLRALLVPWESVAEPDLEPEPAD